MSSSSPLNKFRAFAVNLLTIAIGRPLIFFRPELAKKLRNGGMTIVMDHNNLSIWERLMRRAIFKGTEKKGDHGKLAEFHHNYWTNKGAGFFSEMEDVLEGVHLPNCEFIFEILEKQLSKESGHYKTLVEIGTGNGKVLHYLSNKFPQIDKFIGIDLSHEQTKKNNEKYKERPRLKFVADDALNWVNGHGHGYTVFLTFRGVLEYFTEEKLQDFLNKINSLGKVIFLAIEPIAPDHDFSKDPHSRVFGSEFSFSHNHPRLFKNAGFELWHYSRMKDENTSLLMSFIGAKT